MLESSFDSILVFHDQFLSNSGFVAIPEVLFFRVLIGFLPSSRGKLLIPYFFSSCLVLISFLNRDLEVEA